MIFSSSNSEAAKVTAIAGCAVGVTESFQGKLDCLFFKTGLFNKYMAELSLFGDKRTNKGENYPNVPNYLPGKIFEESTFLKMFLMINHIYFKDLGIFINF